MQIEGWGRNKNNSANNKPTIVSGPAGGGLNTRAEFGLNSRLVWKRVVLERFAARTRLPRRPLSGTPQNKKQSERALIRNYTGSIGK